MTDIAFQNKFSSLPEDLKAQVIDFIDFLLQKGKRTSSSQEPASENQEQSTEAKPRFSWQNKIAEDEKLMSEEFEKALRRERKPIRLEDLHFEESRKALENYKGSFSDAVIEERRSAL